MNTFNLSGIAQLDDWFYHLVSGLYIPAHSPLVLRLLFFSCRLCSVLAPRLRLHSPVSSCTQPVHSPGLLMGIWSSAALQSLACSSALTLTCGFPNSRRLSGFFVVLFKSDCVWAFIIEWTPQLKECSQTLPPFWLLCPHLRENPNNYMTYTSYRVSLGS